MSEKKARRATKGSGKRGATAGSGPKRPIDFGEQLEAVASTLEESLPGGDLAGFYRSFRATGLPFITLTLAGDPGELARACFDITHRLGAVSPAVALAVENHLYVTAALATFATGDVPALESRRSSLLQAIERGRFLVANTNSRVPTDKLGEMGTLARREGEGFRISGSSVYMSLATASELLLFLTVIEGEGPAVFWTRLRDNPGIEIGPLVFPGPMAASDTRRITFRDLALEGDQLLLAGADERMAKLVQFELAWHQILIPSVFLGAAARAIEETRKFLRGTRGPDGRPLAELDGMVADVGRMALRYRDACSLVHAAGELMGEVARKPLELASLGELYDLAAAAKHVGTAGAEQVVAEARRIVGLRALAADHPLERLSQEVIFGTLGPEVNAFIERRYGRRVLGEKPFLERRW
jgi:alkylation response protein AidB-like acyl-CoA dehydrogenase